MAYITNIKNDSSKYEWLKDKILKGNTDLFEKEIMEIETMLNFSLIMYTNRYLFY